MTDVTNGAEQQCGAAGAGQHINTHLKIMQDREEDISRRFLNLEVFYFSRCQKLWVIIHGSFKETLYLCIFSLGLLFSVTVSRCDQ